MSRAAAQPSGRGPWIAVVVVVAAALALFSWLSAPEPGPPAVARPMPPPPWLAAAKPPMPLPVVAAAAPKPAALPFTFVGQWTQAGQVTAILRRDGESVFVQEGERIDGRYRVMAIDETRVVIEDLSTNLQQALALRAGSSAAVPPGRRSAPARTAAAVPDGPPGSSADEEPGN